MMLKNPFKTDAPVLAFLLITVVAGLIYSNTFSSPFVFDDKQIIVEDNKLKDLAYYWPISGARYVADLSFALNYHFGKLNVLGYHLANLTIHVLNGFLVWWLVFLTLKTPAMAGAGGLARHKGFIALAAALLFVAHPIQTQAVTYIVQRFASLATLFYLLSLVMYIQARLIPFTLSLSKGCYLMALLSAVLAMKTKEISFTLPLIIVLYEFTFLGSPDGKFRILDWKRFASLVPFLGTLLIIPWSLLREDKPTGDVIGDLGETARETEGISRGDYLLTQFRVMVTYLRLLVLPVNQNLDYDYPISRSFDFQVFCSFLFLLMIFGGAVYLFSLSRQSGRRGLRLAGFGIVWFFITLSVESSVIPIRDVIYEHRLYLPSVGMVLAFISGIFSLYESIRPKGSPLYVTGILLLLTLVPLGVAAHHRNGVWEDEVTLWEDVVTKSPEKGRGHLELGILYSAQGRMEEAAREYGTALRLIPNNPKVHFNLGVFYTGQKRLDEAYREYQIALKLSPRYTKAHLNLGVLYETQGRLNEAFREYRIVLSLAPGYTEAYLNLGILFAIQGRLDDAAREFMTALKLSPDDPKVHFNLGTLFALQGQLDEAQKEFLTVLKLTPDDPMVHYNLGKVYQSRGMEEEAKRHYEMAQKLKPRL